MRTGTRVSESTGRGGPRNGGSGVFFFQAEDGIRDVAVTGVQTCALPIYFIRRRVADPSDVEDILQDVFYRLVEANRLLMPIEHVTGWLFRVARNRITDL